MTALGALLLTTQFMGSACIFPPELQVGTNDAGPSSPPVITSAGPAPDFLFPGPMILDRQDSRTLSLGVLDIDVNDVIFVRLYVDYGRPNPEPAFAECQAAPTGEETRVLACPVNSLCNPIEDSDQGDHTLEAMVVDREFLLDSDEAAAEQPLYRAVRDYNRVRPAFGSWLMRCNPPVEN
jgi:hypothetical protein